GLRPAPEPVEVVPAGVARRDPCGRVGDRAQAEHARTALGRALAGHPVEDPRRRLDPARARRAHVDAAGAAAPPRAEQGTPGRRRGASDSAPPPHPPMPPPAGAGGPIAAAGAPAALASARSVVPGSIRVTPPWGVPPTVTRAVPGVADRPASRYHPSP